MNRATLLGNVGKQPEIRTTNVGRKTAQFSLATTKKWRDKNTGEKKEKTEWHNIRVWGDGLVGVVEEHVNKGSQLYIEGEIITTKWTDKNGIDRYTTEIVVNGGAGVIRLLGRPNGGSRTHSDPPAPEPPSEPSSSDLDDFVPF